MALGKSTTRRFCKVQHFTVHQTAWSKEVQRDYCDKAAPFIGLVGFLGVRSHHMSVNGSINICCELEEAKTDRIRLCSSCIFSVLNARRLSSHARTYQHFSNPAESVLFVEDVELHQRLRRYKWPLKYLSQQAQAH